MPGLEMDILRRLMKKATTDGARLFRNNCGKLQDRNGRWVEFGIGNPGGSDLIGFVPVTITVDMVGSTLAVFASVEVKAERGRATAEQHAWIAMVRKFGGFAGIARNDEDLTMILCPASFGAQGIDKITAIRNGENASSPDAHSSLE